MVNLLCQYLGNNRQKKTHDRTLENPVRSAAKHFGYMLIGTRLQDEARSILVNSLVEKASPLRVWLEAAAVEDASNPHVVVDRTLSFARNLDGLIISGLIDNLLLTRIAELGIPCVAIGNSILMESRPVNSRLKFVWADFIQMGEISTARLIAAGHRRIGFVSEVIPKHLTNYCWMQGYQLALLDAGLTVDPALIHVAGKTFVGGEPAARDFLALENPPTAYVIPDVRTAASFLTAMRNRGFDVPKSSLVLGSQIEVARLYHLEDYPQIAFHDDYLAEASLRHLIFLCEQPMSCTEEILVPFTIHNLSDPLNIESCSLADVRMV
jgi:hypothetical protein